MQTSLKGLNIVPSSLLTAKMKRFATRVLACGGLGLGVAVITSCSYAERGALVGGLGGAAIGAAVADRHPGQGALIGGAIGAAGGAAFGSAKDRHYYHYHYGFGYDPRFGWDRRESRKDWREARGDWRESRQDWRESRGKGKHH